MYAGLRFPAGLHSYGLYSYGLSACTPVYDSQLAVTASLFRAIPSNALFGACRRRTPTGQIESEGSVGKASGEARL